MNAEGSVREFLTEFEVAQPWFERIGFRDSGAGHRNFVAIASLGVPMDLVEFLLARLEEILPNSADPDMGLNNLERYLANTRSALSMLAFFERKPAALAVLMQMFCNSQYFSDLIITNPEYFDFLWEEGHEPLDAERLLEEILAEVHSIGQDDESVMALIRRHRQKELLRIGYRDIIVGEPLERVTVSISDLADCLVETALKVSWAQQIEKHGQPITHTGDVARLAVLGMGKLGGRELNYSSDIDLIFIHDEEGETDGRRRISVGEFFAGVIRGIVKLLTSSTPRGVAYRVDLRLRPHGDRAPLCLSMHHTLAYYERHGRTWERQALVKARAIAGCKRLGDEFLEAIEPFIYRHYLTHHEINEIKSIKRRIEQKTLSEGGEQTDLKTGHGGIRDIEFVTQFLQLLNGGHTPQIRGPNTLDALEALADHGFINPDEHTMLVTAYRFLRKAEHRLQFMFDLQTHRIPDEPEGLDKLAVRLGFPVGELAPPGKQFHKDLRVITERNRGILNRLMLDLFGAEKHGGEPETDLILEPDPDVERIRQVLSPYRFRDVEAAYRNLQRLSTEESPFLSTNRCRHFLANIAAPLLSAIGEAPDPDMALLNLEKVTASLGAKGVLWESFSINPTLLRLYVQLCSWSQYLSDILIGSPGMIDDLLDSLAMDRPPSYAEIETELGRLLKGARDVDPILHGFQKAHLLRIGMSDVLGRQSLRDTMFQLSELAQALLGAIAEMHWLELVAQHGRPTIDGHPDYTSSYVLIGMGKLGGYELNYNSDLDVVLVYEADGETVGDAGPPRRGVLNNYSFYTELTQRIIRTVGRPGPYGRLYEIDLRLRPTGASGSLVVPLEKFERYYEVGGGAQLWERQALTRARIIHGSPTMRRHIRSSLDEAIIREPWRPELAEDVHEMRQRLEASRPAKDFKRGVGGIVDVEFAVQLLMLKRGREHPRILTPNLWECLERVSKLGLWEPQRIRVFQEGYTFLRLLESRLRIVYNVSRNEAPTDPDELRKLAYRLGIEGADADQRLVEKITYCRRNIRAEYLAVLDEERAACSPASSSAGRASTG